MSVATQKYRNFPENCLEQWKDVPESQIYWLAALVKVDGYYLLKMQWEGTNPQRGIEHLLHYQECEGCQKTAKGKGGYAVFLFCNNRFIHGFDLRNLVVLPHVPEYTKYVRSLINGL